MATSTPKTGLKGLVLAGGKGTRLRPFTYTGAKQLVPLANKPILFYAIESLIAAGITDIGIVVGDTKDEVIKTTGDGSRFGAKITYIEQQTPLGIAHAVKIARDFLGEAPFVLYLGDNLLKGGITPYVDQFRNDCHNSLVLLCPVDDPSSLGVAEVDGGRLLRVVEKPKDPPSDLAVIGIYLFDANVWHAIDRIQPSARGELEITDTIQRLIDDGLNVHAEVISGRWIDTGKHDDLLEANRVIVGDLETELLGTIDDKSKTQGPVVLQEGATVVNSHIEGPAIIGERTRVENSYVGPFTSIYHDCTIKDAEISSSVVLEHTVIEGLGNRIEHSLIGRNVELRRNGGPSTSYRFILGDFSKLKAP